MEWNLCQHKNQFHTKELVLLKSYLMHVRLRMDACTISSLGTRVFKAIVYKPFYLLLLNSITITVGNPESI